MWQGMAHTYSTSAINSLLSMKTVAEIASELTFIQINGQTTLKMDPPRYQGFLRCNVCDKVGKWRWKVLMPNKWSAALIWLAATPIPNRRAAAARQVRRHEWTKWFPDWKEIFKFYWTLIFGANIFVLNLKRCESARKEANIFDWM